MGGRHLSRAMAAAAALATICAASARAQAPPAEAAIIEEASAEATVETTMSATERMLVPVTIGGAGPYPFIVDTAAESSVISRELARELGLAADGRARMLSMTSTRDSGMVRMPDVSFLAGRDTHAAGVCAQWREPGRLGRSGHRCAARPARGAGFRGGRNACRPGAAARRRLSARTTSSCAGAAGSANWC